MMHPYSNSKKQQLLSTHLPKLLFQCLISQSIQRKDREFGAVMAKIEDEASLGSKQQKQIKELAVSQKGFYTIGDFS